MKLELNEQILEAESEFWDLRYDDKLKDYNGVGPAWFPAWARKILDILLAVFAEAVVIHDWDYTHLDKTKENKKLADKRFYRNCCELAWIRLVGWKWIRFRAYAYMLYRAVKKGGDKAFYN